jgi:hypothetical protein
MIRETYTTGLGGPISSSNPDRGLKANSLITSVTGKYEAARRSTQPPCSPQPAADEPDTDNPLELGHDEQSGLNGVALGNCFLLRQHWVQLDTAAR